MVSTIKALQLKPGGGVKWLSSLRELDLEKVIINLSTLPGVGPKVASCVALFSLDQHHAVPVDTHVWQVNSCNSSVMESFSLACGWRFGGKGRKGEGKGGVHFPEFG